MSERNDVGQLTSEATNGVAPTTGLIDHIRNLDHRVRAIEEKLWPNSDGSGTDRYVDNWTQVSDGSNYPGSYGVGEELKPFAPFDDLLAGDSIRVINESGLVDPDIYTATSVSAEKVEFSHDGQVVTAPRDHVVKVIS